MSAVPGPTVAVLLDTRQRHWNQNPYISLLATSVTSDVEVLGFSWWTALFGQYDVVHVHWPEYLVHRKGLLPSLALKVLFALWLIRLRVSGIPVIKTMHNVAPHDSPSRLSNYLLRLLKAQYGARVWLSDQGLSAKQVSSSVNDVVIPHGDYIPWLDRLGVGEEAICRANAARAGANSTQFLAFGIIKRYKSLDEPIRSVVGSSQDRLRLVIAGNAPDRAYFEELAALADQDPRVTLIGRRLPDAELVRLILETDYVVLPYRDLYNSGALMLALSLGRPVVLRRSAISEAIQAEYGKDWVYLYESDFTTAVAESLATTGGRAGGIRAVSPARRWTTVADSHTELYKAITKGMASAEQPGEA